MDSLEPNHGCHRDRRGGTAVALLPAILYLQLTTPLYTSTSNLLIVRTAGIEQSGAKPAIDSFNRQNSPEQDLAEQRDLITSTPVLAAALTYPGVRDCDPLRDHHDLIEFLKRSLKIQTGNGHGVERFDRLERPGRCELHRRFGCRGRIRSFFFTETKRECDLSHRLRSEKMRIKRNSPGNPPICFNLRKKSCGDAACDVAAAGSAELAKLLRR